MFIDVHGHLAPLGEPGGGPPSLRDPEAMIAAKRAAGIGLTIIGSPSGGAAMRPGAPPVIQTADEVRAHNDRMGELVDAYPDALRAYAYLDPFGGDRMLAQAHELLSDWRYVGLIVNTSVRDAYLDSPAADGFFAMAADAGAPVLLHPPACPVGTASVTPVGLVEHGARFCDVTMGLAAIVCAGWLERYPGLRLIAAAGGGGLAFLPEKLDTAMAPAPGSTAPSVLLRQIYVDTSGPSAVQLAANLKVFGADRILFGTDSPPLVGQVHRIAGMVRALPADVVGRIGRGNAALLFGASLPVPVTGSVR